MGQNDKIENDIVVQYGRRSTDVLPGVIVQDGNRKVLKAAYYEKVVNQLDKLSMLMDVARSIMAEIDLGALLEKIIASVTQVMQADRSSLFLVDEENNEIWSRVAQGMSEIRLPLGHGIVGDVAQTGETANIPDAYSDERFNSDFDTQTGYRTRSILCMAIRNPKTEIIGAIQVLNKHDGTPFNEADEDLLSAFCSLAGISLDNARAYEELEKERNSLEVKVQERTRDLAAEKEKSDQLLLNILPEETAEELKKHGKAEPRRYESVTVLFTDFKGFTQVAEKLKASELLEDLDNCFYYFDEVMERNNLEKIKTIGDSYMCAGGLPNANNSHPLDVCLAALEIQNFMMKLKEEKKKRIYLIGNSGSAYTRAR